MKAAQLRRAFPENLAFNALALGRLRPASVLVALEPGRGVWLTRRSRLMTTHAGQVSFPGGKIEGLGETPVEAALREAQEEIGLDPAQVELLGRLHDHATGTGFHITPIVGLVPEGVALRPADDEVEEIFALPFSALLNEDYPLRRQAVWRGREGSFWVWPHPDHVIWGATAEILRLLALRLRGVA
ncbi:NUDIX hydrolase [Acidocella facilis]|uniref:NUDIX hydrolase n=1 Tax=Acidocella facilis TaxID=525 RepID=UPI001F32B406|nr:CoA pyrophosphatase [Acidocella facilis]